MGITLDETDWKILEQLQENARSTFTEIGQKVGLTAPAVRERIRNMEDEGLIEGYRPLINYSALGRPIRAIIELRYKSISRAAERASFSHKELFSDIQGIVRTLLVTGDNECIMEAALENMQQLDFMLEELNTMGFLTVTNMILDDSGEEKLRRLLQKPSKKR